MPATSKKSSQWYYLTPLNRYWPYFDIQAMQLQGRTVYFALLMSKLRESIPRRCYSESQHQAMTTLLAGLRRYVLNKTHAEGVLAGLARLGQVLEGHREADPDIVETFSQHQVNELALTYFVDYKGSNKCAYNGLRLRQAILDPLAWAERLSKVIANHQEEDIWEALQQKESRRKRRQNILVRDVEWRRGPDVLRQSEIGVPRLLAEFNFRSLHFGRSVTKKEQRLIIPAIYESACDLCDILDIDHASLGLKGRLSIGVGLKMKKRGAGHYTTANSMINLTRVSGAGAFAHEWVHALDHYLASAHYQHRFLSGLLSSKKLHDEVLATCDGAKPLQVLLTGLRYSDLSGEGEYSQYIKSAALEDMRKKYTYAADPAELFARAFELWVDAELRMRNRFNLYLSSQHGTPYPKVASNFYPGDGERERIVHVVKDNISALLREAGLNKRAKSRHTTSKQTSDTRPAQQLSLEF